MSLRHRLAAGAAVVAAVVAAPASQAWAAGPDLTGDYAITCAGGGLDLQFDSALNGFPIQTSATGSGTVTGCRAKAPNQDVTSGEVTLGDTTAAGTCYGQHFSGTLLITWNNGQSSTFSFYGDGDNGTSQFHATVTDGLFANRKAFLELTSNDFTVATGVGCVLSTFPIVRNLSPVKGWQGGHLDIANAVIEGDPKVPACVIPPKNGRCKAKAS
jgi:hypothetical protein